MTNVTKDMSKLCQLWLFNDKTKMCSWYTQEAPQISHDMHIICQWFVKYTHNIQLRHSQDIPKIW